MNLDHSTFHSCMILWIKLHKPKNPADKHITIVNNSLFVFLMYQGEAVLVYSVLIIVCDYFSILPYLSIFSIMI